MLDSALTAANMEVYDMAEADPELRGWEQPLWCAIVKNGYAFIAHAG